MIGAGSGWPGRASASETASPGGARVACSGQADPRHLGETAERCFLPDLTRFAGSQCAEPDRQRCVREPRPRKTRPSGGVRPRYSGLRVQGTASSPPSATGPGDGTRSVAVPGPAGRGSVNAAAHGAAIGSVPWRRRHELGTKLAQTRMPFAGIVDLGWRVDGLPHPGWGCEVGGRGESRRFGGVCLAVRGDRCLGAGAEARDCRCRRRGAATGEVRTTPTRQPQRGAAGFAPSARRVAPASAARRCPC